MRIHKLISNIRLRAIHNLRLGRVLEQLDRLGVHYLRIQRIEVLVDASRSLRGVLAGGLVVIVVELVGILYVVLELELKLVLDRFLVLHVEVLLRLILESRTQTSTAAAGTRSQKSAAAYSPAAVDCKAYCT